MTAAARIAALGERGVQLYLDADGALRARCEPSVRPLLDAARPSLARHRAAIVAQLQRWAAASPYADEAPR